MPSRHFLDQHDDDDDDDAVNGEPGRLRVIGDRGGSVDEIISFLNDLQSAYLALYALDDSRIDYRLWRRDGPFGPYGAAPGLGITGLGVVQRRADEIPPSSRLVLSRVRIESPGFWEFVGSLNPLQQIREYLNDRHKRRQDRDYRELAEQERLIIENEILRAQLAEKQNSALRERINILRELGYENDDIDRLIWGTVGGPLSRLGRHQDTKLIAGAE